MVYEDIHKPSNTSAVDSHDLDHNLAASSPARPTSSHTISSTFADSAVDMDVTTPVEPLEPISKTSTEYFEPTLPLTPDEVDQTLSNRMRQLAAVAWTLEQDDSMPANKRQNLHRRLQDLEAYLESDPDEQVEGPPADDAVRMEQNRQDEEDDAIVEVQTESGAEDDSEEWIDESDLIAVRENLAATVKSMRLRQEEQRHLHQLTVQKLEAVAQRCIVQEQQAQDLLREVRELRLRNQTLGTENGQLREKVSNLEADASRNEVAVEAMSSAVKGLEGWIETAHPSEPQTPVPSKSIRRQKVVVRGKGRFRGRYYIDEDGDEAIAYSLADAATESQELHDGVKAWLRGFRDVEEELRQHESPAAPIGSRSQGRFRVFDHREDDDWGDFQSADTYSRH